MSWCADVDDAPLFVRMYELIRVLPTVFVLVVLYTSLINVTDNTARRDPDESRADDDSADDIVFEEAHDLVDVDVFDDVPETLDDILYSLLAGSFIAEALYARRAVGQNVLGIDGETSIVQTHTTASLAGIGS